MKTITMLSMTGALVCAAPALAADAAPTTTPNASQQCKAERAKMGATTFAKTYGTNANGSNAFGKCVSKRTVKTQAADKAAKTNAAKQCKAERTADPVAFQAKYGTTKPANGKGKNQAKSTGNAYGKCVSTLAKAKKAKQVKTEVADDVSASKSCKAALKADAAAFATKYGKARNAFGKCVSTTAKAKADARKKAKEQGTSTPTQS